MKILITLTLFLIAQLVSNAQNDTVAINKTENLVFTCFKLQEEIDFYRQKRFKKTNLSILWGITGIGCGLGGYVVFPALGEETGGVKNLKLFGSTALFACGVVGICASIAYISEAREYSWEIKRLKRRLDRIQKQLKIQPQIITSVNIKPNLKNNITLYGANLKFRF